jgi:hypothetical protein
MQQRGCCITGAIMYLHGDCKMTDVIGATFVRALRRFDPAKTVELIAQYVQECEHEGWAGVPDKDIAAIGRLYADMAMFLENV